MNRQTFFTFPPDLEKSGGVGRPPPPDFFLRQIDFFAIFPPSYDPRQKNIVTSLVSPMWMLISWGTDDDNDDGVGIDANSGGRGGQLRPPSSRRHARRPADLLARDASYGDLRTPLHKVMPAVGPSRPSCWYAHCAAAACSGRRCG